MAKERTTQKEGKKKPLLTPKEKQSVEARQERSAQSVSQTAPSVTVRSCL